MIAGFAIGLLCGVVMSVVTYFLFHRTLPPFFGGTKGLVIISAIAAVLFALMGSHGLFWTVGTFIGLIVGFYLMRFAIHLAHVMSNAKA